MTSATLDHLPADAGAGTAHDAVAIRRTARLAGAYYLVMTVASIFAFMYVPPRFMVPGDATATIQRITQGVLLYRFSVLASFIGQIFFLFLAVTLYHLFRDVDRRQARLLLVLVCVGVAGEVVVIANRLTPLLLASGAPYLASFTKPQLDALGYASLRVGNNLGQLLTMFWGLWLFPFGSLVLKSRWFPRILGWLLGASGLAYVVTCTTFILFPDQLATVSRFMFPLYFGELGIVLWLPIMGAKVPATRTA